MDTKVWFVLRKDNAGRIVDQDIHAVATGLDMVHTREFAYDEHKFIHDQWLSETGGNRRKAILRVPDLDAIKAIAKELRALNTPFDDIQVRTANGPLFCGIVIYPNTESSLPDVLRP